MKYLINTFSSNANCSIVFVRIEMLQTLPQVNLWQLFYSLNASASSRLYVSHLYSYFMNMCLLNLRIRSIHYLFYFCKKDLKSELYNL